MGVYLVHQGIVTALQVLDFELLDLLFFFALYGAEEEDMSGKCNEKAYYKELKHEYAAQVGGFGIYREGYGNENNVCYEANDGVVCKAFFKRLDIKLLQVEFEQGKD